MLQRVDAGEAFLEAASPKCQIPVIANASNKPALARRVAVALLGFAAVLAAGPLAEAQGAVVARGSAEQAYVTGATPGQRVTLLRSGERVRSQNAGSLGGVIFRRIQPGPGYRVRHAGRLSRRFNVISERARPFSTRIYNQLLTPGYGYMRTRDGTQLAINVVLPGPPEDGPYPTLLEYSGYATARPSGPESGIGQIAGLLGYAVVEASMRGTGCSAAASTTSSACSRSTAMT